MIMKEAKDGVVPDEVKILAKKEGISPRKIARRIAEGRIVLARNMARKNPNAVEIVGIGYGLRTKVNANIGTSMFVCDLDMEKRKLEVAIRYGADTVMDLSTGGDLDKIRRELISLSTVPFGTVPIYQAYVEAVRKKKSPVHMTEDSILNVIERHLRDGVDFMTIHAGIRKEHVMKLRMNIDKLVKVSVIGEVSSPIFRPTPYKISATGEPLVLPGVGGIRYNVRVGDLAVGWMADHVEPGVSIKNLTQYPGPQSDAPNYALNVLSCIGNEAKVVSGDAKGEKGYVKGIIGTLSLIHI